MNQTLADRIMSRIKEILRQGATSDPLLKDFNIGFPGGSFDGFSLTSRIQFSPKPTDEKFTTTDTLHQLNTLIKMGYAKAGTPVLFNGNAGQSRGTIIKSRKTKYLFCSLETGKSLIADFRGFQADPDRINFIPYTPISTSSQ